MATDAACAGKAAANQLGRASMRTILAMAISVSLAACSSVPAADPASDAPESRIFSGSRYAGAASYSEALKSWRNGEDVNAWIGARFEYDASRAMRLSETERRKYGRMPILEPAELFAAPRGICVDLARFAVETLRVVDPGAKPAYVMIEFDPVSIRGNTLRRHWVAAFERDGRHYYFADSKRPGYIVGPYASTQQFIAEYARYRGRQIVAFRELDTYERKARTPAARKN